MNEWKHPRLARITTACLLVLITGIGIWAYQWYQGTYNEIYTFYPPHLAQDYNLTQYNYTTKVDGSKEVTVTNFPKILRTSFTLHTTSLSAQNPILVKAIVTMPDVPDLAWNDYEEFFLIVLPGALNYPIEQLESGSPNHAVIKMKKSTTEKKYYGRSDIIYQFESEGGFLIIHQKDLSPTKITDIGGGEAVVDYTLIGDIKEKINSNTKFPVEPVSATTALKMNNTILAFSLLLIDFGIIQMRRQIILGVFSVFSFANEKRQVI